MFWSHEFHKVHITDHCTSRSYEPRDCHHHDCNVDVTGEQQPPVHNKLRYHTYKENPFAAYAVSQGRQDKARDSPSDKKGTTQKSNSFSFRANEIELLHPVMKTIIVGPVDVIGDLRGVLATADVL